MNVLTAVVVSLAFTMSVLSMLIGIAIFAFADARGRRRAGKRARPRRVRSERTTVASRGQWPPPGGRVRR